MRVNPFLYGVLVVDVFLGVIFAAQQLGLWSTSGKVDASGQAIQPSASDTSSIKGWMTLEQVSQTFNVPIPEILAAFELPADTPPSTALKDLESDKFNVVALRTWLSARQTSP